MGLDIGTSSVAVACYWANSDKQSEKLEFVDGLIFDSARDPKGGETLNSQRREKRLVRRQYRRKKKIRQALFNIARKDFNIPENKLHTTDQVGVEPVLDLRIKASKEKIELHELFRVLLNALQRRGARHNKLNEEEEFKSQAEMLLEKRTMATANNERGRWSLFNKINTDNDEKEATDAFDCRERYEREIKDILDTQSEFHQILKQPTQHNNEEIPYKDKIYQVLTFQLPIDWDFDTVGTCSLAGKNHPVALKCTPAFQHYRIEQFIQDQRLNKKPLSKEQKETLRDLLNSKEKILWSDVYKKLNLPEEKKQMLSHDRRFTDVSAPQFIKGNTTNVKTKKLARLNELATNKNFTRENIAAVDFAFTVLGFANTTELLFDSQQVDELIDKVVKCDGSYKTLIETDKDLRKKVKGIIQEIAELKKVREKLESNALTTLGLEKTRAEYCVMTLHWLTQYMKENDCDLTTAKEMYIKENGEPEAQSDIIKNPAVLKPLDKTLQTIHFAIKNMKKKGGEDIPHLICVEFMRDLKLSPAKLKEIDKNQAENRKKNDEARIKLEESNLSASGSNIKKMRLWKEQDHNCPYCTSPIGLRELTSCEIDHIIPRKYRGKNIWSNLILAHKQCNGAKGEMTPLEASRKGYIEKEIVLGRAKDMVGDDALFEDFKNNRPTKKQKLTVMQMKGKRIMWDGSLDEIDYESDISDEDDKKLFNDTSYLATSIRDQLVQQIKIPKENIIPVRGALTAFVRDKWRLSDILPELRLKEGKKLYNQDYEEISEENWKKENKEKNDKDRFYKRCDNRHHFIDACALGLITRSLLSSASKFSKRHGNLRYRDKEKNIEFNSGIPKNIANIREQIEKYLNNYIVWHNPSRYATGSELFEETIVRLSPKINKQTISSRKKSKANDEDVRYLLKRKSLIGKSQNDYKDYSDFFEEKNQKKIWDPVLKASIVKQLNAFKESGLEYKDAVLKLRYPENSKNICKKITIMYGRSWPYRIDMSRTKDKIDDVLFLDQKQKSVYRAEKNSCAIATSDNTFSFVKNWKDITTKKSSDNKEIRIYKGDMIKKDNAYYIVKKLIASQNALDCIEHSVSKELIGKLKKYHTIKSFKDCVLIKDRSDLINSLKDTKK